MGSLGWMAGASTFLQTWGLIEQGKMARVAAGREAVRGEFAFEEGNRNAGLAIAVSHRQAAEERRQSNIAASRALAVAAASGGGVSDPTMVSILSRVKGEGAYRAGIALYEGEEKSRMLRIQGAMGITGSGADPAAGYNLAALGTAVRGATSLYAKYGMNGPKGDAALVANYGDNPEF